MCNRFTRHSMPKSRAFDNQRVVTTTSGADAGETLPTFLTIALRACQHTLTIQTPITRYTADATHG